MTTKTMASTIASKPIISDEIPAANSALLSWLTDAGFFWTCAKTKIKVKLFTLGDYMCHKRSWIFSTCRKYFPILSPFMTYHLVCSKSNTTCATSWRFTAYTARAQPVFGGFLLLDLSILRGALYVVDFLISFGQYVVLRITDDDYPIDIFKPF